MITPGVTQRTTVIDDVIILRVRHMQDRMMTRTGSHRRVLLQDLVDALKGTERRIGNRIGHGVIRARPAPLAPHEIILAMLLEHKGPLHIAIRCHLLVDRSILKRYQPSEIGIQLHYVAMPPATVIHIIGAVVILEDKLVDGLRPIHNLVDQRFAQQILVGTLRTVAHRYTDATDLTLMHIIRTEKQVILTLLANHSRCPHGSFCPFHLRRVNDVGVLRPSDQILGRETIEMSLLLIHIAPRGIDPIGIVIDDALGIGIPTLKYRVTAQRHLLCGRLLLLPTRHQGQG